MPGLVRLIHRLILVVAVVMTVGGLVLTASSFLPFAWAKAKIDSLSPDGGAAGFTGELFEVLTERTRVAGILLLLAATLLIFFRGRIVVYGAVLIDEWRRFLVSRPRWFRTTVSTEPTFHWITLGVILIAGIILRLIFLNQPMRHDEAVTYEAYASRPFYLAFAKDYTPNNQLFHTFLVGLVTRVLGSEPWVIRLPAFVAGLMLIPASYSVIRTYYNSRAALVAAALVAANSALIEYSTNARGYTLMGLVFLLLLLVIRELVRNQHGLWFSAVAILAAVGLCTSPVMLYPIGVCCGVLALAAWSEPRPSRQTVTVLRRFAIALTFSLSVAAVAHLPAIMLSGPGLVLGNRFIQPLTLQMFLNRMFTTTRAAWEHWHEGWPLWLCIVLWFGLVLGLAFHARISRIRLQLFPVAVIICALMIVVHRVTPYRRVWLFLIPLYLGTVAAGVQYGIGVLGVRSHLLTRLIPVSVPLVCFISGGASVVLSRSVYLSNQTGRAHDVEAVTLFLRDHLRAGDRVVATLTSSMILYYYFRQHRVSNRYLFLDPNKAARIYGIVDDVKGNNPDLPETDRLALTLEGALIEEGAPLHRLAQPVPIARFPSATVYLIDVQKQ